MFLCKTFGDNSTKQYIFTHVQIYCCLNHKLSSCPSKTELFGYTWNVAQFRHVYFDRCQALKSPCSVAHFLESSSSLCKDITLKAVTLIQDRQTSTFFAPTIYLLNTVNLSKYFSRWVLKWRVTNYLPFVSET